MYLLMIWAAISVPAYYMLQGLTSMVKERKSRAVVKVRLAN